MFQFSEDLSLVRGAHQLAFGGEYINTRMNTWGNVNTVGQMQFGAQQTGLGLGDFMLGRASSWLQGSTSTFYQRQNSISLYTQDTWKATSKLTVNAGLRWEPFLPFWEKRGKTVLFDQVRFDQGAKSTIYKMHRRDYCSPVIPAFPKRRSPATTTG